MNDSYSRRALFKLLSLGLHVLLFFLFLFFCIFFLSFLLLLLLLLLDLLVPPHGWFQKALAFALLLFLFFLWRRFGRPADINLGDAARGEHAVPSRHRAGHECAVNFGGSQREDALPPLSIAAARHRDGINILYCGHDV